MKPKELINVKENQYLNGQYSSVRKLYNKYCDEDCVVAYRKSFMGITFIIKSIKDIFGFVLLNDNVWYSDKYLLRKELKIIKEILDLDGEEKLIILDEENFKLFNRKILYEGIKNE
jgi:hypothetical protein